MKKILVIVALVLIVSLSADERYMGNVHKYILQEGVKFLEHYFIYEEFHDDDGLNEKYNSMRYGTWKEDANDWIYGYAESNGPNVYVTGIDDLTEWFIETELASITHFWDADNFGLYETDDHDIDSGYMWNQEYTIHDIPSAVTKAYTTIYGHDDLIHYKELSYICSSPQEFNLVEGGTISISCDPGCFLSLKSLEDFVDNHNLFIMGYYEPGITHFFEEPYYIHLTDEQFEDFSSEHPEFVYKYLGRIIHLIEDMAVPAHVHNDNHAPNCDLGGFDTSACDEYEGWDDTYYGFLFLYPAGGYLRNNLDNVFWDADLTLQEYGGLIDVPSEYTDDDFLYDLFYSINQVSDMFASDDKDGDFNSHLVRPFSNYPFIMEMSDKFENEILPSYPNIQDHHEITDNGEREAIRDFCIPTAIRAVATFLHWYAIKNDFTPTWMLLNNVSGNVTLNGGNGDIEDVLITFKPASGSDIVISPDANGDYSYEFHYDQFDTYDITYELYSTDGDYYPITIENVVIDETTSPLLLDDITLHSITDPTNVFVSTNPDIPSFSNIQDAVEYLSAHNSGTINILEGTYTGDMNKNISWSPDALYPDELHITITGIGESIIDLEESGIAFNFDQDGYYYHYDENDMIEGLTIQNAHQGIVIEHGSPVIKNNTIEDCVLPYEFDYTHGAGISCKSSATIENNIIRNNIGNWDLDDENLTFGGGIYIENNTSNTTFVTNNVISGNSAYNGGGIYCTGSGVIILDGNEVYDNTLVCGSGSFEYPEYGTGIYCENSDVVYAKNNLLYGNYPYADNGRSLFISCEDAVIENNTIIDNLLDTGMMLDIASSATLRNNIVSNNKHGITKTGGISLTIDYSCVSNNELGNYGTGIIEGVGCLEEDTEPFLDEDGQPLWNTTSKSPCIDMGNPNLSDPDGTPADIGAIRAVTHRYDDVSLPSPSTDNGWKWLSFPALDNVLNNADIAENVLEDILDPTILYRMYSENYIIQWLSSYWDNDDAQFYRTEGFKFKMNDDYILEVPGFKEPDNSTIVLDGNSDPNWVGYWLDETQTVEDAFADYWDGDNITSIVAQHWSAHRCLGSWLQQVEKGYSATLSYGDMVIIECNTAINDFGWDNSTPEDPQVTFSEPENFTYEEQASYLPLYVEIDPEDPPLEIGAMVDGECVGATVVTDTINQISAYVSGVEPGDIDIELYYGDRAESRTLNTYKCVSVQEPDNIKGKISSKSMDSAYFITLREDSSMIQEVYHLSASNYPNPFNPSTTIAYSLANDGKVDLKVYNIKGQLVKTLVRGEQQAGAYEVVWNGDDESSKQAASGIYFYKLSTKDKAIMKKMLLLK